MKMVGLLALSVAVTAVICTSCTYAGRWMLGVASDSVPTGSHDCDYRTESQHPVMRDPAIIEQKLPALGDLAEVSYLEYENRPDEYCEYPAENPPYVQLKGFATPAPGALEALRQTSGFAARTGLYSGPSVPPELYASLPGSPTWLYSATLSERIGGTSGYVWLDENSLMLYFSRTS
jgi:hypothetical protein